MNMPGQGCRSGRDRSLRRIGGQADISADAVDHGRVGDAGDEDAAAAAVGATGR